MNTGAILGGRPSLGSWVTYRLGSPNQNLPGYVLLYKVAGLGGSANWSNAFQTDQPIAALLDDLRQRGLLDSTLVIWAGEFGRTPMMQGNQGRNHNPYGFTIWMAGGGVQAGKVIGTTDEIGLRAADSPQTVRNLHATILTALGIQPDDLYFNHLGRQERLTGVAQSWNLIPGMLGT
jgi:hypothetical protein